MKGLIATLLSVKDISTATALEVVAGGRLYNVVVDTEVGDKHTNSFEEIIDFGDKLTL